MSIESSSPSFEENITHVEYSADKMPKSHIPSITLKYDGDLPVELNTETRSYEIEAKSEKLSSRDFFEHTSEYDEKGTLKAVAFKNKQAGMFF